MQYIPNTNQGGSPNIKRLVRCTAVLIFLQLFPYVSSGQFVYRWGWQEGPQLVNQSGNYGTKGIPSASNNPGARSGSVNWTGPGGDLWLMGGYGYDAAGNPGELNDLWRYDISTGMWIWVGGSDKRRQSGSYGTKGVTASSNIPGARHRAVSWTGKDGDLWLMGGQGYDADGNNGRLNDLWRYDIANDTWTWVSGTDTVNQAGIYGTKGVASVTNMPGGRNSAVSWTDSDGNFWLMGGFGDDVVGYLEGDLNDLWKYNPSTGEWTWVSGSKGSGQSGDYGTKGVAASSNMPGAREGAFSWTGPEGDLWLMGGYGYDTSLQGRLNDLWKFDISSGMWTWVSGSNIRNTSGTYGTKWVPSTTNMPGGRYNTVTWTGPAGNLWLMGGYGLDASGNAGELNDLWRYDIFSGMWTWISGDFNNSQSGTYGTRGDASFTNVPGARRDAVSWIGPAGHLWLMGGRGHDGVGNTGRLNDLWQLISNPGTLSLDGTKGFGKIMDANELDLSNSLTLEAWIKFDDVNRSGPGQDYMAVMMKGNFADAYGLMLNTGSSNKTLTFYHNGAGSGSTTYDWTSVTSGTWYHVAATYDGSTAKIYIDGKERASAGASGPVNITADPLFIGQNEGSSNYRFDGTLAEIHLWDKALSPQEIGDQMNLAISGKEPGLAGAWLPRTGGRHTAVDQTGNGNNMMTISETYSADFPPIKVSVNGSEGWRFLAAPGDTTTYATLLDPLWTQGFTGSDAGSSGASNVYYYDEVNRTWQVPSSATNVVGTGSDSGDGTGKGALVYVYADDDNDGSNDPFPKTLTIDDYRKIAPVQIPLSYTDTGIYGNDGWHLVANPYPVAIYWQKIVDDGANNNMLDYAYIWDHSLNSGAGGYRIHYGQPQPPALPGDETFDGRIPAFQSFWVKAEKQGAHLRLKADDFTPNTQLYKQSAHSSPYLKIEMEGQGFKDGVSLMFPSSESEAMDPVPKLSSLSQHHAELYLTDSQNQRWVAQNFVTDESPGEWDVPLDIDATVVGEYTLNWDVSTLPSDWDILLEDNLTGERIDLRNSSFLRYQITNGIQKTKLDLTTTLPLAPGTRQKSEDNHTEPAYTLHIRRGSIQQQSPIPMKANLYQNYPNPFNPTTSISYDVPKKTNVTLTVYDMLGREVTQLVNQEQSAGQYKVDFKARDFASGTYIYRLQMGQKVITKKMMLIK